MPVGERASLGVTWNRFICASRLRAKPGGSPPFRPVTPRVRLFGLLRPGFNVRRRWRAFLMPPGKLFLALLETGKIAPARRAAVRCCAQPEPQGNPRRRAVVLLAPGSQFLTVTLGAAREFPGAVVPDTGFPARVATSAAEGCASYESPQPFRESLAMGNPGVPRATLRTRKLHPLAFASIINRLAPCTHVGLHALAECCLQASTDRTAAADLQPIDVGDG